MSNTSNEAKDARRAELKKARTALSNSERLSIDAAITAQVKNLPEYRAADLLLPYLSFGTEVDTCSIIHDAWKRGKTVALPRCVEGTRQMRWYKVESFDGLVKSKFGVDEPVEDPALEIDPANPEGFENALTLVPGLEFDRLGYRLGYGGGFYDVFLSAFAGATAGLCRDPFLQEQPLQHDDHDMPVGIVVTNTQVIRP